MADNPTFDLSAVSSGTVRSHSGLDPRLQLAIARHQVGEVRRAAADTDVDEVAVIARVADPDAWANLSEVRAPSTIGPATRSDGVIVTGRIPVRRIEAVREQGFVLSLAGPAPLRPTLSATIEETSARPDLLPADHQVDGGAGVVVGIIDYGCDFAHANFRHTDGSTRLLAIWDQDGSGAPPAGFSYGREHDAAAIDQALGASQPYQALGYTLHDPDDKGTHGTHVMDIAAGNGAGSGTPGMAPRADLVFVDVSHADIPFQGPDVIEKSFGDSVMLLEALKYIFDKAGERPCVVNVSLGTNGGPHDGTTLVEQGIDALLAAAPNRAVTIAAGNAFADGIHAAGRVAPGGTLDLSWELQGVPRSDVELELWYGSADRLEVELLAPNGASLATVAPGAPPAFLSAGGNVAVVLSNQLDNENNGDNTIGVFLTRGMPAGIYTVRLRGLHVVDGGFQAWIERDNNFQSQFAPPHDNRQTIGSISCGHLPFAVGSYDAHKPLRPLSFFSSAGPTRDGRQKPELSAPGHNVLAAKSATQAGVIRKSGTSMAAPAVAGLIALVFAEARAHGLDLTADELRGLLLDTVRRDPPVGSAWDDRYGLGRVSAAAAVQTVIDRSRAIV